MDSMGREDSYGWSENSESADEGGSNCVESKSGKLMRRVNSQRSIVSTVTQLQRSKSCDKFSFLRKTRASNSWIPKHVVTVDEKHLRQCLELIHITASKVAPCNMSLDVGLSNVTVSSDLSSPARIMNKVPYDLSMFDFDCRMAGGTSSLVIKPVRNWIVGSVMGSKSMVNLLKSPLLMKYGAFDGDGTLKKASFIKAMGSTPYDLTSSPSTFSDYSPQKSYKESPFVGNHAYGFQNLHDRLPSRSSTNSTYTDQSSSSSSSQNAPVTQAMLQCTWNDGNPHFVFSVDDQKVVYLAEMLKIDPTDNKAIYYTYLFYSRSSSQKNRDGNNSKPPMVGKMKVSTSFTLCGHNSRVMEREFVLFGGVESSNGEMQNASLDVKKNKGLSKKVSDVFRSSHSIKKRTLSRFGGSGAILEYCPWDPVQDAEKNIDTVCAANLLEDQPPPNLELAAVIVKDHLPNARQENVGGWGMKFLNKVGLQKTTVSIESSAPSCCTRDSGDCSTSVDVLIPAAIHGGPRTRNGTGPSPLIERWRSHGHCDCGGWDLGCPLKVLRTKSDIKEISSGVDMLEDCKLTELFVQGSENATPPLRMVNVHDGLYFVHFQSTLSALQSFSIAIAFIHSWNPGLRPKVVQEFE